MDLGTIFVKRPVMTTMFFAGVALFGLLSYTRLAQELFPNISVPQLVIVTKYPNAAPEEIENLITKPIEEAVGTVPNLKRITSKSKEGISAVKLQFGWGTDMGLAHLAVREKLDQMKDRLPLEAEESVIKRVNPFTKPIMVLSITGNLPLGEMTELCDDVLKKKLEKTDGVGGVQLSGGQKKEIVVEVDRGRIEANRLSLQMVVDAVKNANFDYPAGVAQGPVTEYLIRTAGAFQKIDDINKTIIRVETPEIDPIFKWKKREEKEHTSAPREQRLIPLFSMAAVIETLKDKTSFSRYNGKENISISILKQADANSVKVSQAVKETIKELKLSLPKSLGINIVYDESDYIVAALDNMRNNFLVGVLLASFVLLFFLGSVRDAVSVGLAIPVSLMIVFVFLFMGGISINILSLAGLALTVGNLSDNAIVVMDNITRHIRELKKPVMAAAIDGTNEMVAPMITSSLTNVVVFLPLLFVSGVAQQLFRDLFYVIGFATVASLLVSLSLMPRMAASDWKVPDLFNPPALQNYVLTKAKRFWLGQKYATYLVKVLKNPRFVIEVVVAIAALALVIMVWTPHVFMPKMDQGQFIVQLTMPIGTRLEVTNNVGAKLENVLLGMEGVDTVVNVGSAQEEEDIDAMGAHEAQIVVTLGPNCKVSTDQVLQKFKSRADRENLEGGQLTYVLQDSPLKSALSGGAPLEVEIKGSDFEKLRTVSDDLVKKMEDDPGIFGVKSSFGLPSHETKVVVDKDRAASYQLSVADIAKNALIAIKGFVATTFKKEGKETDIRVRLRKEDRNDSSSIRNLSIRTPMGTMVSMNDVAQVTTGAGTSEIVHLDQQRAVVVSGEVTGEKMDSIIKRMNKLLESYRGGGDLTITLGGESKRMAESFSSLRFTLFLAIILVYMIMAAQFESLIQPLIIMVTVPLSFIGVAFTIFLTNTPLSSVVILGILILAGIVVNNGIILIDHINFLREQGKPLGEAVLYGSVHRIAPILMTMLTTVLAVLPLALGIGKGDDLAQPLAVVTFGGLFVSTLLTLFLIPMIYYKLTQFLEGRKKKAST